MATREEYASRSREERLARIARTGTELADAIRGKSAAALGRRPDATSWAPVEVICHLRDNEEWFLFRLQQIVLMDEPRFPRTDPDRWARERQYIANDAPLALRAFEARRAETLEFLGRLQPDEWRRAGVHVDSRGRRSIDEFLTVIAWHDDNHLEQLGRALEGRP